jgi:transcriptional regulator with XRE-family HTH domain
MENQKKNPHADIGGRVRRIRDAHGYTQAEMAELSGVSLGTYNGWETGYGRISIDGARRVKVLLALSLDYIYDGDMSALTPAQIKSLTGSG